MLFDHPLHIAIVGGGPSGCYTALALRKRLPEASITIFDARHTPFGLVRYGVAADHQGMKGVSRQFDRLFVSPLVHFVGNVTIGVDVTMESLSNAYHFVVLATGLEQDRNVAIPTSQNARVYGAGALLKYLNADPDTPLRSQDNSLASGLGPNVTIIGTGNVALDLVRLLAKTSDQLAGSDIDDDARVALGTDAVRQIRVVGRGSRAEARWDGAMLDEVCALSNARVTIDGEIVAEAHGAPAKEITIEFERTPVAIETSGTRTALHTVSTRDPSITFTDISDSVVTATGFASSSGLKSFVNTRCVSVGGCDTGVLGNLAENRLLAKSAAEAVAAEIDSLVAFPGIDAIRSLLHSSAVSFEDWQAIDREELRQAPPDRSRRKITSRARMDEVVTVYRSGLRASL